MTRNLLEKIAKQKKINLALYDHVFSWICPLYKWVYIKLYCLEGTGFYRTESCVTYVKLSVRRIMDRCEPEWEYTTNGPMWIMDLK